MKFQIKKKILVLADSPTCNTGFGQVSRNILKVIYETGKYEIDIVGINYDGKPHSYPYNIYPARSIMKKHPAYMDSFGRQVFLDLLIEKDYDIVFTIQDTFQLEILGDKILEVRGLKEKKFKWILYYPIDATPKKEWIKNTVLLADYPVAYSNYAKEQSKDVFEESVYKNEIEEKVEVIYHGVDTEIFRKEKWNNNKREEMRKTFFGDNYDKFIFMNMNRNQPRKDMFRGLYAGKQLKEEGENTYFYFHCQIPDPTGLDLLEMGKSIDFKGGDDWGYPRQDIMAAGGVSVETINKIYNCVDSVFSTTLGEGFGLSTIEAMATGRVVILPDNTVGKEILGEDRGYIVKTKEMFVQTGDNNRPRKVTDTEDLIRVMKFVMENPDDVKKKVNNAYNWIKDYDWSGEKVGGKWLKVFNKAEKNE